MELKPKKRRAPWWQLYAMLPMLVVLFLLELRLHLPGAENVVAQLGILGLVYGLIHLWMTANREALMDEADGHWEIKVYEVPPASLPTAEELRRRLAEHQVLHIPTAGVKGVLGTTFEMDEFEEESSFPAGSAIHYSEELFAGKENKDAGR